MPLDNENKYATSELKVEFRLKESLLSVLSHIPDRTLRDSKTQEVMTLQHIHMSPEGLPQLNAENISDGEIQMARSNGIDPKRYPVWINAILPSDRPLARDLVKNLRYIKSESLQRVMCDRLQQSIDAANGGSVIWVAVSRKVLQSSVGNTRLPSGFTVGQWNAEYLQQSGFIEHKPTQSTEGPCIDIQLPGSLFRSPVYRKEYIDWETSGNPPAVRFFEKNGQHVTIVSSSYVSGGAETPFAWEDNRELGAFVFGEDWAISGSHDSNVSAYLPQLLERYERTFRFAQSIIFGYGVVTKNARANLESFRHAFNQKVILPYDTDSTIPSLIDLFDQNQLNSITFLSPYKNMDLDSEHHLKTMKDKVLVHSGISVPDNIPDVMRFGPWRQIKEYPLITHPNQTTVLT